MQAKSLIRTVTLTEQVVPEDALRLCEDILCLGRILRELRWIDPSNVAEDPQKGRRLLRYVQGQVKQAQRHARELMQARYLAPKKVKEKIQRKA